MQEVIETVIYTGFITDEVPVSIIIVGPSGSGKSKMLARYQSNGIRLTDSITSKGLYDISIADTKKEVRFLFIPDLNPTLSRKPSTVEATVANLLSFTSDGTVRIDDGRNSKECKHDPIGIITSCTPEIYTKQARRWFALGLRRRIIPIFFDYTLETQEKLQTLVMQDKIHSTAPGFLQIKSRAKARPAISPEYAMQIKGISSMFALRLGKMRGTVQIEKQREARWFVQKVIPISPQVTLGTLVRAHALRANRAAIVEDDYSFLCRFLDFCDPEHPKEI